MLARFKTDVLAEKPDLVLWQVGTNSVLRDNPLDRSPRMIADGHRADRDAGADVVLIDPQFVPKVIAKPETDEAWSTDRAPTPRRPSRVFHRFAIMRHWHESDLPFEAFTSPDGLHMNDWGYGCWAKLLSASIAHAVARPTVSARLPPLRLTPGRSRPKSQCRATR